MSTRCNIHFCDPHDDDPCANIYRHSDGYPDGNSGVPADMERFFDAVLEQCPSDTRFGDPEYLAAKFLVWSAIDGAERQARMNEKFGDGDGSLKPLDFLSISPCVHDHGDIEYVYKVTCSGNERPEVTWEAAR